MNDTVEVPPDLHLRLHQASAWHAWGDDGRLYRRPLHEMTDAHRRRVIDLLRRNARALHEQQRQHHLRELMSGRDYLAITGDLAALGRTEPEQWLEQTALMRRLHELTPAEPRPPRRHRFLPWRLR